MNLAILVISVCTWILTALITYRQLHPRKDISAIPELKPPAPPPPPPRPPVCGCKHHYCFHDLKAGTCSVNVDGGLVVVGHDQMSTVGREQVRCPCLRYTGPEPVPDYFDLREIGS